MNKKRKEVIANNEISEIYTLNLGGYNQKILVEGKKKELPIVIFLHGGPGTPIPFSVGCRGLFPQFTDKFIMVYWDQLGCGINNYVIDEQFTIEKFVDMTEDLICEIKKMFPENHIYIFATSWGSVLSAKVLERVTDIVKGVVVCGQIIKEVFFNEEVYEELHKSKLSEKKLSAIRNANVDNITSKELQLVSSSIKKYTNGYENKSGEATAMGAVIFGLLTSPDYKFKDFKAIMMNGYLNNVSLWKELLKLDLSSTLKNIKTPYTIIQGDTDIVASTKTVQVITKDSTYLKCKVVNNSGHYPNKAVMDTVYEELITQIYGQ